MSESRDLLNTEVDFDAVLKYFKRRRKKLLGILAVTMGRRIRGGSHYEEVCIRVYVKQKIPVAELKYKVPKFAYGRSSDGRVNYSIKIPTDVVSLEVSGLCCMSGSEIRAVGERGTLTLLFKNKREQGSRHYLITCSHVVGNMTRSPPVNREIESPCCGNGISSKTVANSVVNDNVVEYDIALVSVPEDCANSGELKIDGRETRIRNFLSPSGIVRNLALDCSFPISRIRRVRVSSGRVSLPFSVNGKETTFKNLFAIDAKPRQGDSGGLLFFESSAVGILVAFVGSEGYFQPIEESFEYLKSLSGVPAISCFE